MSRAARTLELEMSETPQETLNRWLLNDGIGIPMLGAPPEVRDAIRAVLTQLRQWKAVPSAMRESVFPEIGDTPVAVTASVVLLDMRREKAEAERDALRIEIERLRSGAVIRASLDAVVLAERRREKAEAALRELDEYVQIHLSNRGSIITAAVTRIRAVIKAALRDAAPAEEPK